MSTFLITVTGLDHPGITARLTGLLSERGATLHEIEQVVVQRRLTLALSVTLPSGSDLLEELRFAARELGVTLDFEPVERQELHDASQGRYVVTAIGPHLGARELHAVAQVLAEHRCNIDKISQLAEGHLGAGSAMASVEIRVRVPAESQADALKRALLQLAMRSQFDVALQRESLYRRSKRLVVMDMDSTLIRIEVIDELARAQGVVDQVSAITERAMQGEMDYDESLRQRLALLKGLDVGVLEKIARELPLTDGAETLVRVLRRLGFRTAVISGGFSIAADALKARLGIDHAFSNVPGDRGWEAHGARGGAHRQRAAQGGAAGEAGAGGGHPPGSGDRGGRRRQRPADAATRGAGHRLPRQAQAARGGGHVAQRQRAGCHPVSSGAGRAGPGGSDAGLTGAPSVRLGPALHRFDLGGLSRMAGDGRLAQQGRSARHAARSAGAPHPEGGRVGGNSGRRGGRGCAQQSPRRPWRPDPPGCRWGLSAAR